MKAFLFALAFLLLPSAASAQGARGELIVGVSRSAFESEYWSAPYFRQPETSVWVPDTEGSLIRPVLGISGSVQLYGPLWIRAEALAVTKGYTDSFASHRALFFEVPLLTEVELPWRDDFALRLTAGVAPSIEVSCSAHIQLPYGRMEWIGPPMPYPVGCSREREVNDLGVVYGLGFGPLRVGSLMLVPEVRAVQGRVQRTGDYRSQHRTVSTLMRVSW